MSTSFNVLDVQRALNRHYHSGLTEDGKFGPLTKEALVQWGAFYGLSVVATGSTGSRTVRIDPAAAVAKLQSVLQTAAAASADVSPNVPDVPGGPTTSASAGAGSIISDLFGGNGAEAGVQIQQSGGSQLSVPSEKFAGLPKWLWWVFGGVGAIALVGLIAWGVSRKG